MKKFLMVLFLMLLSVITYAFTQKETQYLLQNNKDINLTQGIDFEKILGDKSYKDFTDFSSAKYIGSFSYYRPQISTDNNFLVNNHFDQYYKLDFAEDPFDGKIQVLVMGEPLPSPLTTLICSLGVIGILFYCKKKKQVTA